jgi:hypothetical protein
MSYGSTQVAPYSPSAPAFIVAPTHTTKPTTAHTHANSAKDKRKGKPHTEVNGAPPPSYADVENPMSTLVMPPQLPLAGGASAMLAISPVEQFPPEQVPGLNASSNSTWASAEADVVVEPPPPAYDDLMFASRVTSDGSTSISSSTNSFLL